MAPSDPTPQLVAINPYFLVGDVHATAEYYRDVLGFGFDQFWGDPPAFVMVKRDGIQIMLRQPARDDAAPAGANRSRVAHSLDAYVYVRDIDALYTEFRASGAKLLCEPSDQPHDCREFELEDLNGYVICFGQDLLA